MLLHFQFRRDDRRLGACPIQKIEAGWCVIFCQFRHILFLTSRPRTWYHRLPKGPKPFIFIILLPFSHWKDPSTNSFWRKTSSSFGDISFSLILYSSSSRDYASSPAISQSSYRLLPRFLRPVSELADFCLCFLHSGHLFGASNPREFTRFCSATVKVKELSHWMQKIVWSRIV